MKEAKENKIIKGFNKFIKIFSWTILIALIIIAGFLIYYVMMAKKAEKSGTKYQPPMALYTIISPSMEPAIKVYDVVFTRKVKDYNTLEVGDIITFISADPYLNNAVVTHRIYEKQKDANNKDKYIYTTKGDNNKTPDSTKVEQDNIIGKVNFKIPQLGKAQFFLSSKGGWFIIILVPALGIISYDLYKLFKLLAKKNELNKGRQNESEEE